MIEEFPQFYNLKPVLVFFHHHVALHTVTGVSMKWSVCMRNFLYVSLTMSDT